MSYHHTLQYNEHGLFLVFLAHQDDPKSPVVLNRHHLSTALNSIFTFTG